MINRKDIQAAIDAIPKLNDFGIGVPFSSEKQTKEEVAERYAKDVQRLLDSTEQFENACEWIRDNLTPTKTINQSRSSYGLKHIAEREIGYITNGLFIAAMHHCGYLVARIRQGPNAEFNVSEKSVRKASERTVEMPRRMPVAA